ncbi:hypothetical protein LINPERPRIM_LOCUS40576 [Linum perenne]
MEAGGSSGGAPEGSKRTWASVVAQAEKDLRFVEESKEAIVDGVLRIPKAVLDEGRDRMKGALVGQFSGAAPPI